MTSKRNFAASQYMGVSQDHLVVAALWFLIQEGRQTSFENLVAEAYLDFPERFQLEGYPDWPNAHVVGKAWVRCRTDKRWMTGSASEGFSLTPLGEKAVRKVLDFLAEKATRKVPSALGKGGDEKVSRKGSGQTISSRVVRRVEKSTAYSKFVAGSEVSEYDFCDLLYCTLESTPEVIAANYEVVRQQVEGYGRKDLGSFLDSMRNQFPQRFVGRKTRGGLMPQKVR